MGVRVAYGQKGKIDSAIASGVIPTDSLIITSDSNKSELYFYDVSGKLKSISERDTFETFQEAQEWVLTYDCSGRIISVHNGANWTPYIVTDDKTLSPVTSGEINIDNIKVIDGGSATGIE